MDGRRHGQPGYVRSEAHVPFEKGLPVERVMSTFPAIETVVDNIRFTAGFENLAQVMDRAR